MKLFCFLLLLLSSLLLHPIATFTKDTTATPKKQTNYKFIHEFARLKSYNPDYLVVHKDVFGKYNKTSGGWNFLGTLKQDLSNDFLISVQAFVFRNNEFKRAPVSVDLPVCDWLERNGTLFNAWHVLENSNITTKCPIKAGTYYAYDMLPDAAEYPAAVPSGRWLVKLTGVDRKSIIIGEVEWIARVEYF